MIAVVTAIFDHYDELKPTCDQRETYGHEIDWVCVTDDPGLGSGTVDPLGWRIVYEPAPGVHPNRAAKTPKMLPWAYTDADASVWIDASYQVTSALFVADVLSYAAPIAQFVHPWRDCALDEAAFSSTLARYADEPLDEQAAVYRDVWGFPAHWGLWATGVIARRHTPEVRVFGELWLLACTYRSYQDQVSEPPALWFTGLRPITLPGNHMENPWLLHKPSGRHG
jgi:hypothetical protein